ncbi:50S ribosomal protein L21 [Patescibacteria group bacterium]|nr:50S ribosomal protein L21 [Patescibacteria group bacterium]
MKFAVIKTGGKQYKVCEGEKLKVEKLNKKKDESFDFDQVLLFADGDKTEIGTPSLNRKVKAKILDQGKAKKIRVVKYKPKIRYHKVYGHRQPFTQVQIEKIS